MQRCKLHDWTKKTKLTTTVQYQLIGCTTSIMWVTWHVACTSSFLNDHDRRFSIYNSVLSILSLRETWGNDDQTRKPWHVQAGEQLCCNVNKLMSVSYATYEFFNASCSVDEGNISRRRRPNIMMCWPKHIHTNYDIHLKQIDIISLLTL